MKTLIQLFFLSSVFATFVFGQSIEENAYIIEDSVSIRTKTNGVISATIVRRKTNTTPLPAILFYTTYYQGANDSYFGKISADRDYVGVIAYTRGIRTKIDDYMPYEHEYEDLYQIIDWISTQPWCNGEVAMFGGSYTGFSQWSTTKNLHPALKTIVPQVAVMPGFDTPFENGVPYSNILGWPNEIFQYPPLPRNLPFLWYEKGSSFRSLDSLAGRPNKIFQKWLQHPTYDDYWKAMVPTPEEYSRINIPVLSTTGYYDGSQIGSLQYLKLHTRYNKNANHYFVIGPYDHWGGQSNPSANLMGYTIDSVANISMRNLAFDWIDFVIKKGKKPDLLKDKINYQVMGTNKWFHAPSLDKMNNDTLIYYLSKNDRNGQLYLSNLKDKMDDAFAQVIDFKDRSDSTQHNYFTPFIINKSLNTSNGLVFETPSFDRDFVFNGTFSGILKATINKKDIDLSVTVYEQRSDGIFFYLTRFLGRASLSNNVSKRQLLKPGQKEIIPVNVTRWVSKKISKGSKLVVILNVNKHPFDVINYGTGRNVYDESIKDAQEPLKVKWHNDSFIKIPVMTQGF